MSLLVLLQGLTLVALTGDPAAGTWEVPAGSFHAAPPALQVELLEGTTVRKTTSLSPTATLTTTDITLTTGERDAIVDWSNLRVRLTKSDAQLDVFRVELETPALQEPLAGTPAAATWALPTGTLTTAVAVAGTPPQAGWAFPSGSLTTAVALTGTAPATTWGVVDTPPLVAGLAVAGDPAAASWAIPSGSIALVGTPVLDVALLEGATVRASWTATTPVLTALTESFTLSEGERNSIGDWGALRVRLTKSGAPLDVLRAELETPAAGSGVTLGTTTAAATWGLPGGALATDGFTLSGDPAASTWGLPGGALTIPGTATLQVDLLEGATTRATWTLNPGASYLTSNYDLSPEERDAIGDWGNLQVRLTKSGAQVDASFVRLEAPPSNGRALGGATVPSAGWGLPAGGLTVGTPLTGTAPAASWGVPSPSLTASGPTVQVELLEGTTVRATYVVEATALAPATATYALSPEERAAIGNWGNLYLRLTNSGGAVQVYDLELELPDAVSGAIALGAGVAASTWIGTGGTLTVTVGLDPDPELPLVTWGVPAGLFVSGVVLDGAVPSGRWAVPPVPLVASYLLEAAVASWGLPAGVFDTTVVVTATPPSATWTVSTGAFYLGLPLGQGQAVATWGVAEGTPLVIKYKRRNWDERVEATATAWLPRPEATASGWTVRNEGDV